MLSQIMPAIIANRTAISHVGMLGDTGQPLAASEGGKVSQKWRAVNPEEQVFPESD